MSDVEIEVVPALGGAGSVEEDLPCFQCAYNLRGLAASGLCPECNAAITHSLHGTSLKYAGREYLQKLHLGLVLVILSMLVMAALHIEAILSVFRPVASYGWVHLALVVLSVGACVTTAAGYYFYITPWVVASKVRFRARIRRALLIVVVLKLALIFVQAFGPLILFNVGMNELIDLIDRIARAGGLLLSPVLVAMVLLYTRELAERLGDASLAASARRRMWILPPLLAALALVMFFNSFFGMLYGVIAGMIYVPYLLLLNRVRWRIRGLLRERRA